MRIGGLSVWPLTLSLLGKSRGSLEWHQTSFDPVQCRWPDGDRRSQVTRIVKPESGFSRGKEPGSRVPLPHAPRPDGPHGRRASYMYRLPGLLFRPVRVDLSIAPLRTFCTDTFAERREFVLSFQSRITSLESGYLCADAPGAAVEDQSSNNCNHLEWLLLLKRELRTDISVPSFLVPRIRIRGNLDFDRL